MTTYEVALDVFEGPLDLLLRLIEHNELDITLVSLALVTDQYLAFIAEMRGTPAASLADFLVIAGRLLVLKSRVLLPRPEEPEDEEEEEWETDLVERLREYKRYKQVAAALKEVEESGQRTYPRLAPPPKIERRLRFGEASVDELVAALRRALEAQPHTAPVDDVVSAVVVRMSDCIRNVLQYVRRYPRVRFSTVIKRARSRTEIIVHFLAILELIKQQQVRATQDRSFGEIYLESREPDPDAHIAPIDLSEYGESEEELPADSEDDS